MFTALSYGKSGVIAFFNGYLAYTGLRQWWSPRINLIGVRGAVVSLTEEQLEGLPIDEAEKRRLRRAGVVARTEAYGVKTKYITGFTFMMQIASMIITMSTVYGYKFAVDFLSLLPTYLIKDKPHWTTYRTRKDFQNRK
jgi:hypothetical protein